MAMRMTSDLPTRVKVGFRDYRIEPWSAAAARSNGFVGETSNLERTIKVELTHGTREAAATLLHEIMHAINFVFTIKDEDKEERRICLMESGLATVWRDNPDVLAWIGHNLVHGS